MFKNMKIGTRLAAGFAAMGLIMLFLIGLSLFRLSTLNHEVNDLANDKFPKTVYANEIIGRVNEVARAIRNVMLLDNKNEIEKELDRISESRKIIGENLGKLEKVMTTDKEKDLFRSMTEARAEYVTQLNTVSKLVLDGKNAEAKEILFSKMRTAQKEYLDAIAKLIDYEVSMVEEAGKDAIAIYQSSRNLLIILGLMALVLAATVGLWITKSITRPLAACMDSANKIARGDMKVTLNGDSNDETGMLQKAMQQMVDKIKALVTDANMLSQAAVEGKLAT